MGMRVIEIAGLAGSGKSTVTELLSQFDGVERAPRVHIRKHLHCLFRYVPKCIKIALLMGFDRQTWTRFRLFLYLELLLARIDDLPDDYADVLLLDQGPIHIHAFILGRGDFHFSYLPSHLHVSVGDNLKKWATVLDTIIWLDASNSVLLQRVVERNKTHYLKTASVTQRDEFFERYRTTFGHILLDCNALGVKITKLHTDDMNIEEVINTIDEHELSLQQV